MKTKKGQMGINQLQPLVITVGVVGIITAIMLVILGNLSTATGVVNYATVSDENYTFLTNVAKSMANTNLYAFDSLVNITNTLPTSAYTVNLAAGTVTLTDNSYNNTQLNASYQIYSATSASTSVTSSITAIAPVTNTWLGLIVTIVVLVLLLAIVLNSLGVIGGRR